MDNERLCMHLCISRQGATMSQLCMRPLRVIREKVLTTNTLG